MFKYLAFIAYLRTKLYREARKDRRAIQLLKRDSNIRESYLEKIRTDNYTKNNWIKIKEELDRERLGTVSEDLMDVEEIKWWNCSHDDLQQKTEEEKRKLNGVIHSLEDWENMVEFWYSVRNNLFHGIKNPEEWRDQFAVKYGYKTLRELVKILLNEHN